MRWNSFGPLVAGAAGAALLLAACSSSPATSSSSGAPTQSAPAQSATAQGTPAAGATPPQSVTVAWADTITTLNPYATSQASTGSIIGLITGTLQHVDSNGVVSPGLATSETTSSDGLTLTYTLRSGLVFSDGTPLTASDVAATFNYNLTDASNVRAGSFKSIKSVAAPNPTTVVITLKSPEPSLPAVLASQPVFPASAFKNVTGFFANPISDGPYVLTSLSSNGDTVVLTRNPKYYGTPDAIETVKFSTVADVATRMVQLKAGTVDLAMTLAPSALSQVDTATTEGLAIKQFGLQWLWMNDRSGPLSQVNVRKAINDAINRTQINQLAFDGLSTPVANLWPTTMGPFFSGTSNVVPATPDLSAAKALLQGTDCANGCSLNIQVQNGDAVDQSSALVLQQNLAAIGIKLNIVGVDKTAAGANELSGDFTLESHAFAVSADIPDTYLTVCCVSTSGLHSVFSGWNDPTVNSEVATALSSTGAARMSAIAAISTEFAKYVPYIPLVDYAAFVGESKAAAPWLTVTPGDQIIVEPAP